MILQEDPPRAADHRVHVRVDRSATVPRIAEPTNQHAVEVLRDDLDRTATIPTRQLFDLHLHFRQTLTSRVDIIAPKRQTQERKTLSAAVRYLRFVRMQL